MATIKQIDSNRRNAQLSTGPRTEEGKQRAAANALKSGIFAESQVIPGEDPAALQALTREYHDHHEPATPEARALIDSLVHHEWLLRRLRTAEAAIYNCDCSQCDHRYQETSEAATISLRMNFELRKFDFLQRRINATERNFHRSLKALQTLEPPQTPPQPIEPKTTSGNLASFPHSSETPSVEALNLPAALCSAVPTAPKTAGLGPDLPHYRNLDSNRSSDTQPPAETSAPCLISGIGAWAEPDPVVSRTSFPSTTYNRT